METLFELKFTSKDLERNSKRCKKDEGIQRQKLKKALQDGNIEGAKIYAANSIRNKNESINFLQLASRVDAVANRVQAAVTMNKVSKNMVTVVNSMGQAMKNMNIEKV